MAEIGREHHEKLLMEGLHPDKDERNRIITEVLNIIQPDDKLNELSQETLGEPVNEEGVALVLRESTNGSLPGLNGITYEFYKMLQQIKWEDKKKKYKDLDIVWTLTMVYRDIEEFGVDPKISFIEGWMCPIYKKGDRSLIRNYQPMTLLNVDYKMYTKDKSIKLANAIPQIIHPNQVGFILGRSIADQVRLAKIMVKYAECKEENSLLIALDQEKVYNKICHNYLDKMLEAYNLPERFRKIVKLLYKSVEMVVMINRMPSAPFKVSRGVWQGDPLSCLLFNLAIEPLANLLQRCKDIEGYKIPREKEMLVVTMFTNGMAVYMADTDNLDTLWKVLKGWCTAAGARFIESKTEVISIGTEKYRTEVLKGRKTGPNAKEIDAKIHIARKGK